MRCGRARRSRSRRSSTTWTAAGRLLRHRRHARRDDRPPGADRDRAAAVHRVGRGRRPPLRRRRHHRPVPGRADRSRTAASTTSSASTSCSRRARARGHHAAGRTGRCGVLEASRQPEQGFQLELARRTRGALGDRLTADRRRSTTRRCAGPSFYDLFIDRSRWPRLIRRATPRRRRRWTASATRRPQASARAPAGPRAPERAPFEDGIGLTVSLLRTEQASLQVSVPGGRLTGSGGHPTLGRRIPPIG